MDKIKKPNEKIKISIIIPMYNAENTIKRCINSILKQDIDDKEIILIDDGSSDKTYEICKKYYKQHSNIKLINQCNSGVSSARNKGLEVAKGDYIAFVDSDDFVNEGYYQQMIRIIEEQKSDIVISGMNRIHIYKNGKMKEYKQNSEQINLSKFEFSRKFFSLNVDSLLMGPCNKLYKSRIAKIIKFDVERICAEDYIYNLSYFINCKKISFTGESGYNYVYNMSSITNTLAKKYSSIYELEYSLDYRKDTKKLYLLNGIKEDDINAFYLNKDCIWFYQITSNLFKENSPYNKKDTIIKIKEIMGFDEVRNNILRKKNFAKIDIFAKMLCRINSPALTYYIFKILSILS